jgi:hypothetical protein
MLTNKRWLAKSFLDRFKVHLDLQEERLEKFNLLAMRQIERIRFNNQPPGVICYTTGIWCGASAQSN